MDNKPNQFDLDTQLKFIDTKRDINNLWFELELLIRIMFIMFSY